MFERQNQLVNDRGPRSLRKPYTLPELTRHGTVVELTHSPIATDGTTVGSGIVSDNTSTQS